MSTTSAVDEFAEAINRIATDPSLEPSERIAALRPLRDDLSALLGQIQSYMGSNDLMREGAALTQSRSYIEARENANVREEMLSRGMASPEQLDGAGYISHDELDAREQDGTIHEWLVEAKVNVKGYGRRGPGGKIEMVKPSLREMELKAKSATNFDVNGLLKANPKHAGEPDFEYAARVTDGLSPETKHEVIYRIRERCPVVKPVAEAMTRYRKAKGLPEPQVDLSTVKAPLAKAHAVGSAFEVTPDQSQDPHVRECFEDFKSQNSEMWELVTKPKSEGGLGIKVDFKTTPGEPYNSAVDQAHDVEVNHHLTLQSGLGGDHSLLSREEYDRFRAVHDIFGHVGVGGGFDRHGEYQAWLAHMSMYTGLGRDAMSSEYHGVNTAMWAGASGSPGTGKSVLLDKSLIQSPFDEKGHLIREAAEQMGEPDSIDELIHKLGLNSDFANRIDRAPLHPMSTTQARHSAMVDGKRQYSLERKPVHDDIVENALASEPVVIDPDVIKEQLPEGPHETHHESLDIARRIHHEATAKGMEVDAPA